MRFKAALTLAIGILVILEATALPAEARARSSTFASRAGQDLGPVDSRATLNVVLLLKGRNEQQVLSLMRSQTDRKSPYFRRWLTPAQYAAYFGPAATTVSQTLSDLSRRGFSVRYIARNGRIVVARAPVGIVDSTFATQIHFFRRGSESYYANVSLPTIPATLPGVESVGGLDSFSRVRSHAIATENVGTRPNVPSVRSNAGRATPNPHATVLSNQFGFGPQDLYTAYDLNSVISGGTTGSGVTIALILTRQALQSDLNNFDQQFGLPSTSLNRTFLSGTCSSPCPLPTGQPDINEAAIDTEWAHAAAPGATIDTVSVGDDLTTSFVLGIEYVVDQLGTSVQIASISFATCETGVQPFEAQAEAALVDQGVLEGQTWFAASGDFGADGCFVPGEEENDIAAVTELPASVPDVVAVGGTSMVPNVDINGNVTGYSTESALDDWTCSPDPNNFVGGASGGGQSLFYPMPTWQQGKTTNDTNRDVPDVSLYADIFENAWPPTCPSVFDGGYYVNIENVWVRQGGTSVASPVWAGIFALIEQKLSSRLGLVSPELYNLENSSAFHQVTMGNNTWNLVSGYNTGAGYNRVTGLGTPDGAQLVSAFAGGVNPTPEPTAFPPLVVHVVATPNPLPTERAFIPNGGTPNGDSGDVNIFEATPGFALGNLVQDFQDLGRPLDVAFNATGSTVYVLEFNGSNVDTITTSRAPYVISLDKYSAVATFGTSIALKGSNLYVTDAAANSLTVVPTGGGAYAHVAVGANPGEVVANPQKSFVYVTNSSGNSVSVVKTTTNAVTQTIPVGSNPVHLAVTSDGATLFVANQGAGTVTQINVGVTPAVVQRTYFVGGEPTGIAVNADNSIAYVTNLFCPNNPTGCTPNNQSNGVVEQIVFSPIGFQPVRCCLVVGQLPVADAFDPSGQYLWVIESGSFEATVIDTFTNQIYGNFSTGASVGQEWNGVGNFVHAVPH